MTDATSQVAIPERQPWEQEPLGEEPSDEEAKPRFRLDGKVDRRSKRFGTTSPSAIAKQSRLAAGLDHVIERVGFLPGQRFIQCVCGWRHDGARSDVAQGTAFYVHVQAMKPHSGPVVRIPG